jgi:hypothetical protein
MKITLVSVELYLEDNMFTWIVLRMLPLTHKCYEVTSQFIQALIYEYTILRVKLRTNCVRIFLRVRSFDVLPTIREAGWTQC